MSFPVFDKDPNAVLDYIWDWEAWLDTDNSEVINSHTIVETGDLVVDSSTDTDTTVTAWVSAGSAGTAQRVTCRIVTNQGRTDDRSIIIRVKEM
jgi:hypothetical protein